MTVVIRLVLSEEDKRAFKEMMGAKPTRAAIKIAVTKAYERMIYPDGRPKAKNKKFTLRKS